MIKFVKQVLVVIVCLSFFGYGYATRADVVSQDGVKYLGTGYNAVQDCFIYDNMALEYTNGALESQDGVSSTSYYSFVESKKELTEKFTYNFSGHLGITLPIFTASTDLTREIVNNTSFTSDKITIIAYWKQVDKKIHTNGLPRLSDSALSILSNSPLEFHKLYGDKYVKGVTLGKMFYIVYQADTTNLSSDSKNSVKAALEFSFNKILGAKLTTSQETFISQKLSNVSISSFTYAYGINNLTGIYSTADFQNVVQKINSTQSAVIARELEDYSLTANSAGYSFYNVSEYANMANAWRKHYSMLNYIYSSPRIGTALKMNSLSAINDVSDQLNRVYTFDSTAKYPDTEINTYNTIYNSYISQMNLTPRWYTMPDKSIPANGNTDLDFSCLGDVEVLMIEAQCPALSIFPTSFLGIPINLTFNIKLYINKDGNLSNIKSTTLSISSPNQTLYQGVKFADKFRVTSIYTGGGGVTFSSNPIIIKSSFKEKMTDLIWLYVNGYDQI